MKRTASVVVAAALVFSATPAFAQKAERPPDIVVIMTDDQRTDLVAGMPFVSQELVGKGMAFDRAIVNSPSCCPARAGFLTGEYSHTNGVWTNLSGASGGWLAFLPSESDTVATWLTPVYETALFGKYLNGYDDASHIPPGWDRWVAFVGEGGGGAYYDYDMSDQGIVRSYGTDPAAYSTDVLAAKAVEFIAEAPNEPLFMLFTPYAPHGPATYAPRHLFTPVETGFTGTGGAVNERDVSDKPRWVRRLDRLSERDLTGVGVRATRQARSLLAVDEAVASIVAAMEAAGRTNTLYVFMSDQGIEWAEHRWTYKLDPYEATVRIPLVVRWDDKVAAGTRSSALVQNIDLAPTFAELAGLPQQDANGTSLLPLLLGSTEKIRTYTLFEHLWYRRAGKPTPPSYCAVRTARYKYVRYANGEEELYSLVRDPHERNNWLFTRPKIRTRARYQRLSQLTDPECSWLSGVDR